MTFVRYLLPPVFGLFAFAAPPTESPRNVVVYNSNGATIWDPGAGSGKAK